MSKSEPLDVAKDATHHNQACSYSRDVDAMHRGRHFFRQRVSSVVLGVANSTGRPGNDLSGSIRK